jgi:gas vesicle protein
MKSIKLLIVIALISVITVSCKETKKEEVKDAISTEVEAAKGAVKNTTGEAVEGVEKAVDSLSADIKDAAEAAKKKLEEGAEAVKEGAEKVKKEVKVGVEAVKDVTKY